MSIQALRERRSALAAKARKLLDDHQGERFNVAVERTLQGIYDEIEGVDREILAYEKALQGSLRGRSGGGTDWRNADTGEPIVIARAGPDLRAQLEQAMPRGSRGDSRELTLSDFLRGVAGARTTEAVRAALSEGTDSAGGFTLPSYLQVGMLEALAANSSLMMAGAGISAIDVGAKNYRIAAVNALPSAAWRSENGTVATSDPTFRGIDLTPRSLAFQFKVSRELLMDSPNIEEALRRACGQAFAVEMDRAGLRGSGTAPEIRGILNTVGIGSVTNGAAGTALGTIKWANLTSAVQTILTANAPAPSAAIMHPRTLVGFANLADSTGQPLRRPQLLEDMPFIPTSQIPINLTVGGSTDCTEVYIGDFRQLVFFVREGASVALLKELYAGTGEVGFLCHMRVDVALLYPSAFVVATGVRP